MSEIPALPLASFGRRLLSLCYELLLLAAILFIAGWIFLAVQNLMPQPVAHLLLQLYLLTVCGGYFVYCWTHGGQTLPMKTWRLKVVMRDGTALSSSRAALRYVLALLSVICAGIGFLWPLIDPQRQYLHDRIAGTRIVNAQRAN